MFLLRSAFWLTIGFLVVAPHGTDLGATASHLRDGAIAAGVAAGQDLVASQIAGEMQPARLVSSLSSLASALATAPMHRSVAIPDVVVPYPRPAALG